MLRLGSFEGLTELAATPFNAITSGQKVIESRLYDEKRQLIQIGDSAYTSRSLPISA